VLEDHLLLLSPIKNDRELVKPLNPAENLLSIDQHDGNGDVPYSRYVQKSVLDIHWGIRHPERALSILKVLTVNCQQSTHPTTLC